MFYKENFRNFHFFIKGKKLTFVARENVSLNIWENQLMIQMMLLIIAINVTMYLNIIW